MPEPKRISDRQIEALHAIAEAGQAIAAALRETQEVERERDEARRDLAAYKETFHGIMDAASLSEWHTKHCGAAEGAERLRKRAELSEMARDDAQRALADVERFVAEVDTDIVHDGSFTEILRAEYRALEVRLDAATDHAAVADREVERLQAQIAAPVPAERTHSESGDSRTLGERLRALIPDTYSDDGYFGVTALEIREFADEADRLEGDDEHTPEPEHDHQWVEATTYSDRARGYIVQHCTIPECGVKRRWSRVPTTNPSATGGVMHRPASAT